MEIEGRSSAQLWLFLEDHRAFGRGTGMYVATTCAYMSGRDKVCRVPVPFQCKYDWKEEPLVFLLAPAGPGLCAATSRMDLGVGS